MKVWLAVKKYLGDAFKEFLSVYLPDSVFSGAVKKFRSRKERALSKVVTTERWEELLSKISVKFLDITLLGILVKNYSPKKDAGMNLEIPKPQGGWFIKSPRIEDKSKSAWCLRLISVRNKVFHSPLGAFSEQASFDAIMVEIEEILKGFGSPPEALQAFRSLKLLKLEEVKEFLEEVDVRHFPTLVARRDFTVYYTESIFKY